MPADVLSDILKSVRIAGSVRFGMAVSGNWRSEGKLPLSEAARKTAPIIPFHLIAEGTCWVRQDDEAAELVEGDVVAFPLGHDHVLGLGQGGQELCPMMDLQTRNAEGFPLLRYGEGPIATRILCGFIFLDAVNFAPLREAMPRMIVARPQPQSGGAVLQGAIRQIIHETDTGAAGAMSVIERLTEIILIELLRSQMMDGSRAPRGLLIAMKDEALGRGLAAFHAEPYAAWSATQLARASGVSRTILEERFAQCLGTSPMRYVREWRLYLASKALATTNRPVSRIAEEAGYGTEAAFTRAFARAFGLPPGQWRSGSRQSTPFTAPSYPPR